MAVRAAPVAIARSCVGGSSIVVFARRGKGYVGCGCGSGVQMFNFLFQIGIWKQWSRLDARDMPARATVPMLTASKLLPTTWACVRVDPLGRKTLSISCGTHSNFPSRR